MILSARSRYFPGREELSNYWRIWERNQRSSISPREHDGTEEPQTARGCHPLPTHSKNRENVLPQFGHPDRCHSVGGVGLFLPIQRGVGGDRIGPAHLLGGLYHQLRLLYRD